MTDTVEISVIAPVLNEQESLPKLYEELTEVLDGLGRTFEIVIVDDGSTDNSLELARKLVHDDPRIILVELRRQFGKATALQAGFNNCQGQIVFTMDADLQDDPREIPRFLEALDQGHDLVSGYKKDRNDPIGKTLPSKFFNWVTAKTTGITLKDFNCGFKAYRREVIEKLHLYGELYRYIPVMVHALGYRVGEIAVTHRPRQYGKSKYGLERFMRGGLDLFTILFLSGFNRRPLHLFGLIGAIIGGIGFLIDGYLAIVWLSGAAIGDRPLLMLGTLMIIVGIQVIILGLLGEMIASSTYKASEVQELVRRVDRQRVVESTSD